MATCPASWMPIFFSWKKNRQVEAKLHDTYYTVTLKIRPYQDPSKAISARKSFQGFFPVKRPDFTGATLNQVLALRANEMALRRFNVCQFLSRSRFASWKLACRIERRVDHPGVCILSAAVFAAVAPVRTDGHPKPAPMKTYKARQISKHCHLAGSGFSRSSCPLILRFLYIDGTKSEDSIAF